MGKGNPWDYDRPGTPPVGDPKKEEPKKEEKPK